jgi:hypothetical protein
MEYLWPSGGSSFPSFLYCLLNDLRGIRDSAVGIATGYGLEDREVGVRVPVGLRTFSSSHRPDQLWAHPASYPMGTVGNAAGA